MAFQHYTRCYSHTTGDKPFNSNDLATFVLGVSAPGFLVMALGFLAGGIGFEIGFWALVIQYAVAIKAVAQQWLYHRLVCLSGNQCAVGTLVSVPTIDETARGPVPTPLGEFDNDDTFDIRLMPHRLNDVYKEPNCNYATFGTTPALIQGPPTPGPAIFGWAMQVALQAGPSLDGLTEKLHPANDVFLDRFQGSALLQPGSPVEAPRAGPVLFDLPYDPIPIGELALPLGAGSDNAPPGLLPGAQVNCTAAGPAPNASGKKAVTRSTLHCEAEGNFWQEMMDTAGLQGLATGAGGAAGAAAGAALGCEIGAAFAFIGCAFGALLGFLAGLFGGSAAGAYLAAVAAFHSIPGNVNDANVGDVPLGPLQVGDQVVVLGTHVYDGYHEGWHELHPLMAIQRVLPSTMSDATVSPPYLEWDPNWVPNGPFANTSLPAGLSVADMRQGLESPAFRAMAVSIQQQWCSMLSVAFDANVRAHQERMINRWTIHPMVDGCQSGEGNPAPLP
jgi:hypothetical protein